MSFQYKKQPPAPEWTVLSGTSAHPADFRAHAISVPCQDACPALTDVPGYIEKIAQGSPDEAYTLNLEANVFPGVLGRVCVRPCQTGCRHNRTDIHGPVEICHLKRAAADTRTLPPQAPSPFFPDTGKKTAVVGGGPAGLTAARELRRLGHSVTLFEKEPRTGGMLRDGIPRFRLPEGVLDEEIGLILDTGIHVRSGEAVDRARMEELLRTFDAVVIATGTTQANSLKLDGLEKARTWSGLDFMKAYNHQTLGALEGNVVIIGGGFTAVDTARACARTARRLLGENGTVTMVYRRSAEYLAADLQEQEEMAHERIQVRTLLNPVALKTHNGKPLALTVSRNYLGPAGDSGKPEIFPVPGSETDIPCDHLIIAIGQKADMTLLPEGVSFTDSFATSHPRLFVAGDFLRGSLDVIHAVADGKGAARAADTLLMGHERLQRRILVEPGHANGETGRFRGHDTQFPLAMGHLPVAQREPGDAEVALGLTPLQTQVHATRCYLCQHTLEIDQEKCIGCKWCKDVSPRNCIKEIARFETHPDGTFREAVQAATPEDTSFIWIDSKECIRCGKCLRICPTGAITMKRSRIVECASGSCGN